MKVTDEMVETAAQALHHIDGTGTHPQWDLEWDYVKADYRQQAKAALEAVAPLIRADEARAIAKTCDELSRMAPSSVGMVADLLHSRADKLEREAGQ